MNEASERKSRKSPRNGNSIPICQGKKLIRLQNNNGKSSFYPTENTILLHCKKKKNLANSVPVESYTKHKDIRCESIKKKSLKVRGNTRTLDLMGVA